MGGEAEDGERERERDPVRYSAANPPRFSLLGYIEAVDGADWEGRGKKAAELGQCFTRKHPDARYWLPGNRIHESHCVRLVVTHVYWVGGFGDRAYIGWILNPHESPPSSPTRPPRGSHTPGTRAGAC